MRRPSHATVVAYTSLFVALGGTSFAAATIARNAVVSSSIKDGQVKTADLGANAVTSAKVKAGSLLASDLKAGELPAAVPGPQGPAGATGPAGAPGAKGDPGTPGADGTNGTNGSNGTNGTNGTNGVNGAATRVRAAKTAGDVTVPGGTPGSAVTIPLTQNAWTQGATETDLFLVRVTVTAPATCTGGAQGLLVNARLGGTTVPLLGSHGGSIPFAASETSTHSFVIGFLLDPGAATPRTVTLTANNGCSGGQDYTVTAAAVNVVASL
ncbi:MAG TPA: collagen-like protein [Solirubrobacteraceae bacterium]|nr:collagen-like protein [Solirubrobacteraceae bacterium]